MSIKVNNLDHDGEKIIRTIEKDYKKYKILMITLFAMIIFGLLFVSYGLVYPNKIVVKEGIFVIALSILDIPEMFENKRRYQFLNKLSGNDFGDLMPKIRTDSSVHENIISENDTATVRVSKTQIYFGSLIFGVLLVFFGTTIVIANIFISSDTYFLEGSFLTIYGSIILRDRTRKKKYHFLIAKLMKGSHG